MIGLLQGALVGLVAGLLGSSVHAATGTAQPNGRVSYIEGALELSGSFDGQPVEVSENAIVSVGDELRTPAGSFAEVELTAGSFLRLAGTTAVYLDELDGVLLLVLQQGTVSVSRAEQGQPIRVVLRDLMAEPDSGSRLRAELSSSTALVRTTSGNVELVDAGGREVLTAYEYVLRSPGDRQRGTWSGERDAFDQWVEAQVRKLQSFAPPEHLARADEYVGLYELAGHGDWIWASGGWVWRPSVAGDWRPYSVGSWAWIEPHGWVWVPRHRWAYVTHHYGRWTLLSGVGWVWVPHHVWGPAWVSWGVVGSYVAWAPLGTASFVGSYHFFEPRLWVYGSPWYFYHGGGTYRHHEHREVIVVASRAQVGSHRGRPVNDPSVELAPRGRAAEDNVLARITREHRIGHTMSELSSAKRPLNSPRAIETSRRAPFRARPEATKQYGGVVWPRVGGRDRDDFRSRVERSHDAYRPANPTQLRRPIPTWKGRRQFERRAAPPARIEQHQVAPAPRRSEPKKVVPGPAKRSDPKGQPPRRYRARPRSSITPAPFWQQGSDTLLRSRGPQMDRKRQPGLDRPLHLRRSSGSEGPAAVQRQGERHKRPIIVPKRSSEAPRAAPHRRR